MAHNQILEFSKDIDIEKNLGCESLSTKLPSSHPLHATGKACDLRGQASCPSPCPPTTQWSPRSCPPHHPGERQRVSRPGILEPYHASVVSMGDVGGQLLSVGLSEVLEENVADGDVAYRALAVGRGFHCVVVLKRYIIHSI